MLTYLLVLSAGSTASSSVSCPLATSTCYATWDKDKQELVLCFKVGTCCEGFSEPASEAQHQHSLQHTGYCTGSASKGHHQQRSLTPALRAKLHLCASRDGPTGAASQLKQSLTRFKPRSCASPWKRPHGWRRQPQMPACTAYCCTCSMT